MVWNGLDTGGVEQLWDDQLILAVLEILNRHQPFALGSYESPVFGEFEEIASGMTWYSIDKHGGKRPIFRRANPLIKIGLVEGTNQSAVLSPWATEILSGNATLQELYQFVAKSFVEQNGDRSLALIAHAALLLPDQIFSESDVALAIAPSDGSKADILKRLSDVRSRKLKLAGPRRIRGMLRTLVRAGALANTTKGYTLANEGVARRIVGVEAVDEINDATSLNALGEVFAPLAGHTFSTREIAEGARHIPLISAGAFASADNSQRALLLERAHTQHENMVEHIASEVRVAGGTPVEGNITFDVGCWDAFKALFEVKHITARNALSQFRKATAQLPEYRWRHEQDFGPNALQVIAVTEDPLPILGPEYLDYIRDDRKLEVIWRSSSGLTNQGGQNLQEILAHLH